MSEKTKTEASKAPEKTENKDKKVKIRLLCDVYYGDDKLQKWTELELEKTELEKFAKSFYENI